jgi:cysteine desulfurase/selenocysteine lyase
MSVVLPTRSTDFIGLQGITHLAAAGEAPILVAQPDVLARYARDKARGLPGIVDIYARVDEAKDRVAFLMGVERAEIGFALNVAQAMSAIARTLDRPGGNVVLMQWEFSSAMYPWITGTELEVRHVKNVGFHFDIDQFAQLVDSDTQAIVVSLVSYYTGERIALAGLRELADTVGAALIVDASHALGAAQFDARAADFVVSCGYKWVLGIHGAATAFCNAARQPDWQPRESGWRSTVEVETRFRDLTVVREMDGRRFELGNPAILSALMVGEGADYLNRIGIDAVDRYLTSLTGRIVERLDGLGLEVLTPRRPENRAGIVSFLIDDVSRLQARFDKEGIVAWTTEGRVRLSPHIYTSREDVERTVDAIEAVIRSR